jgi:hypothetical protein
MVIDPRTLKGTHSGIKISDHKLCVHCGYDLFGIDRTGVCPECGTPASGNLYDDSKKTTPVRWLERFVDPRPTASIMELDLRDMRRMGWATGLVAAGATVLVSGCLGLFIMRTMIRVTQEMDPTLPASMMFLAAIGGLLWMAGISGIIWPRRGKITPRVRRRPLGDVGATSATKFKSQFDQNLRWVGEWWPMPVKLITLGAQSLLPIAAMTTAAMFLTYGFERYTKAPDSMVIACMWLWVLALLAQGFACLLLIDLARSCNDDSAGGKLNIAAFGGFVGILIDFASPWLQGTLGGWSGVPMMLLNFLPLLLLPLSTVLLVAATWSLFSTARWAPRNKLEMEEKERAKQQRQIERGQADAEHTWKMGY